MRIDFKMKSLVFAPLAAAMILSSCGSAEQAQAPNDPLKLLDNPKTGAEAVQSFEAKDMQLPIAVFFLWRKDVVREHVDQMTKFGGQVGGLRYLLTKKAFLEKNEGALKAGLDQVGQGIGQVHGGL